MSSPNPSSPTRGELHERHSIRTTGLSDDELDAHRSQHRFLAHVAGLVAAAVDAGDDAAFAAQEGGAGCPRTAAERAAAAPAWDASLMAIDEEQFGPAGTEASPGAADVKRFSSALCSASSHVATDDLHAETADAAQGLRASFADLACAAPLTTAQVPATPQDAAVVEGTADGGVAVLRVTALHLLVLAPADSESSVPRTKLLQRAVQRVLQPRCVGISAMLEALMPPTSMRDAAGTVEPALTAEDAPGMVEAERTVAAITALFEETMLKRRPAKREADDAWVRGGRVQFAASVRRYVAVGARILFVLPAFPFKSSNEGTKVLGPLPDFGEYLALRRLDAFLAEVDRLHAPGSRLVLFSDGRVYCDHFRIPDATTSAFKAAVRTVFATPRIVWSDLDMFYPGLSDDGKRAELEGLFGASDAVVDRRIKEDPDFTEVYCGFKRFMTEELAVQQAVLPSDPTKKLTVKQMRVLLGGVARSLMRRNYAYGAFVQLLFPVHVRLSIHPSTNTRKFSVNLVGLSDWGTPWHNCALLAPDCSGWSLVRRQTAEEHGCPLLTPATVDWAQAPFDSAPPAVRRCIEAAPKDAPFFLAPSEDTVAAASPRASLPASPTTASPTGPATAATSVRKESIAEKPEVQAACLVSKHRLPTPLESSEMEGEQLSLVPADVMDGPISGDDTA